MKYLKNIKNITNINTKSGEATNVRPEFFDLSAKIINRCAYSQSLIQDIIYNSYSEDVHNAGKFLKNNTYNSERIDFINNLRFLSEDPDVDKVFLHAKRLFALVYNLRNRLAHDIWLSDDQFPDCLLLASLDEQARLQFATGKLVHIEGTTSKNTHDAIIRYIRSIKVLSLDDLQAAFKDIQLCNLCLMQISMIFKEKSQSKINELKKTFYLFKGLSHLFPEHKRMNGTVEYKSAYSKNITI